MNTYTDTELLDFLFKFMYCGGAYNGTGEGLSQHMLEHLNTWDMLDHNDKPAQEKHDALLKRYKQWQQSNED